MTLIMMDITMAKRSIMYDTNESYDSSKVVEVSRVEQCIGMSGTLLCRHHMVVLYQEAVTTHCS